MSTPFPVVPRIFAGVGALGVALTFGMLFPANLLAAGYTYTAFAMLATTIPLVAFLGLIALAPGAMQPLLARRTKLDLRDGGHIAAAIVIAATLFFVLGYGSITNGVYAYEHDILRGESSPPIEGSGLFSGLLINIIVLVLPPIFYVAFVNGNAFEALGLHLRDASRAIAWGFGTAIGVLIVIAILSYTIQGLNVEVPENERALEIAKSVTVLGAFGIAIASAVSEEVFFRGFLQPRVGLLGQAVLFSLAHLSYLNVLEIVVVFTLAIVFGLIYRHTKSLLAPMAGHFLFNLLMLLAGIYAPTAT